MKGPLKLVGVGVCVTIALFSALWLATDGWQEWQRERSIRSLVASGASRLQVTASLAVKFTDYSVGSSARWGLEESLAREPATADTGLRVRVARYPGVWFHTTFWTQTWLFFDAKGRLRDYYTCAQ